MAFIKKTIILFLFLFTFSAVFPLNKEVQMTEEDKKILNRYFTQFSEAGLSSFGAEGLDSREIIRFAVFHLYKTRTKLFRPAGEDFVKINQKYVEEIAGEFFGITLQKHESINRNLQYKSGFYIIPVKPEKKKIFSQVSKLIQEGSDLYTAYINTYTADPGFSGDKNADPTSWTKDNKRPQSGKKMKALVRKIGMGNTCTYFLLEYREAY